MYIYIYIVSLTFSWQLHVLCSYNSYYADVKYVHIVFATFPSNTVTKTSNEISQVRFLLLPITDLCVFFTLMLNLKFAI